jgi:hypothetical protein
MIAMHGDRNLVVATYGTFCFDRTIHGPTRDCPQGRHWSKIRVPRSRTTRRAKSTLLNHDSCVRSERERARESEREREKDY